MKKILLVLVCFVCFSAAVSAQRQTRPRVVPSPAPTISGETSDKKKNAPVLIGKTQNYQSRNQSRGFSRFGA
jgi:hypothetical protein